jgi:hypothetical protein
MSRPLTRFSTAEGGSSSKGTAMRTCRATPVTIQKEILAGPSRCRSCNRSCTAATLRPGPPPSGVRRRKDPISILGAPKPATGLDLRGTHGRRRRLGVDVDRDTAPVS